MVPEPVSEKLVPEKVLEPLSVRIGIGKKSWNRYRKYLVPRESTGIGIGNIWHQKKVSESVSLYLYGCLPLFISSNNTTYYISHRTTTFHSNGLVDFSIKVSKKTTL